MPRLTTDSLDTPEEIAFDDGYLNSECEEDDVIFDSYDDDGMQEFIAGVTA